MSHTVTIHPQSPEPERIQEVTDAIRQGAIAAYPTETFYGLGVDVTNEYAIKRLFDLKRRDSSNPIAVIVSGRDMLADVVHAIPPHAEPLIAQYWPGPLTILFPTSSLISKALTTNTGKIGIRISSHPVAQAITLSLGRPLTTTSANLSGFPPAFNVKHVKSYFKEKIDVIADGGELLPSRGSTVVDVSEEKLVVIREGDIPTEDIFELFEQDTKSEAS